MENVASNESGGDQRLGMYKATISFNLLLPASIPLLHRLTLDSDGYSGGDSVVAIILDVTCVISTGAPHDVC